MEKVSSSVEKSPAPSKTSILFKLIVSSLAFALSVAWIFFSKKFLQDTIKTKIFNKNPLKTLDDSIDLLADVGLYAALYLVSLTFTVMMIRILNHSVNPAINDRLESAEKINQLIRSFTQSLVIFACLFLYFLQNSKSIFFSMIESMKSQAGFFLPFWFLSGYVSIWLGNFVQLLIKREIGFVKMGQLVVFWTFIVLLAEISGFRLFKLI